MNKKNILGILALMLVGVVLSTGIVSAYRGDYTTHGPNYSEERHNLMTKAFEDLDYEEWSELMSETGRNPRVLDLVTKDNFDVFAQAHQAGLNGDVDKANELRASLGLNNGNGPKDGTGYGRNLRGSMKGTGMGQGRNNKGLRQNFVDNDNDGECDNLN